MVRTFTFIYYSDPAFYGRVFSLLSFNGYPQDDYSPITRLQHIPYFDYLMVKGIVRITFFRKKHHKLFRNWEQGMPLLMLKVRIIDPSLVLPPVDNRLKLFGTAENMTVTFRDKKDKHSDESQPPALG